MKDAEFATSGGLVNKCCLTGAAGVTRGGGTALCGRLLRYFTSCSTLSIRFSIKLLSPELSVAPDLQVATVFVSMVAKRNKSAEELTMVREAELFSSSPIFEIM